MDSTGVSTLRDPVRRSRAHGSLVLLTEVRSQPLIARDRAGFLDEIVEAHLPGSVEDVLDRARRHLTGSVPEPL